MTTPVATGGRALQVLRVIDAIRVEVGRYYGTLAVINLLFGTATMLLMWSLGMPNPMLWGALAAVLNFIPYLGCASTFVILTVVAFVSFDAIIQTLLVGSSFLLLAAIEGHIIEPVFLGRRLDLNPIVVLVALWVGAWVWGIAGMVIALPFLVVTKVAASRSQNGAAVVRFLSPPRSRPLRCRSSSRNAAANCASVRSRSAHPSTPRSPGISRHGCDNTSSKGRNALIPRCRVPRGSWHETPRCSPYPTAPALPC
jgi:hypothetical protein